ncbi:MATE family efflux transporter [Terrisporobacter vanillatitrophus]|uniref:MATE family efflux transporter n=1 Tax=Terrisporobacter vanillatitrophus TaxID=3058402 RepID=UPI003365DF0D
MENLNLLKDDEKKVFYHYLIPSICSTLVTSIYILVDTLVIGQGVGAEGISALNIFLPFFAAYNGIGLMFGVGGGILISMEEGMGNKEESDKYFVSSLVTVVIIGLIFTTLTNIFLEEISYFLGANENSIDLVLQYGRCITIFTPIFIATNFLSPIIRNKKSPKLAMMSVLLGAGLNIVLDYIFVFPMNMGMMGAALATVLGSLTTVIVLLTHFISKKNRIELSLKKVSITKIKRIIGCGGSSFLMEVASGFVIFIFNIQILKYIGDMGIVVYGIISNCVIVGMALFNGVAQASQPIIATNYGANESRRVKTVLKYAMFTTISIGCLLYTVVFMFAEEVIYAFVKANAEIISMGVPAVRDYLSAFCIMNINILLCNYFQSVGKEKPSIFISVIRGFLLNIILVLSLPIVFGGYSLWFVVPITEVITLFGIIIYIRKLKSNDLKSETKFNKVAIAK